MLISFLFAIISLFLKYDVSAQTSPCPNYFKYNYNGINIQGIVTLPGLRGINNLSVKIMLTGNYDKKEDIRIDFADDKTVTRNNFISGRNVRYKIIFPQNSDSIPIIVSISLNGHEYCTNDNAFLTTDAYTLIEVTLSVNTEGSKKSSKTPTEPVPTYKPIQPTQPSLPVQSTEPISLDDNLELDFHFLRATTTTTSKPSVNVDSSVIDRSWLNQFTFNDQCGSHFSALHTIINGRELTPNEFPWLVALFDNNRQYFCGGSLISDKHVLTAAHCCIQQNWIVLEFGKHVLSEKAEPGTTMRLSQKIIYHPEYKRNTGHGDIALIVISEKVTFSEKIKPICLWPFPTHEVGTQGTVAGWGNDISGLNTDVPMSADVNIVSDEECLSSNKLFKTITSDSTFCAGGKDKGPCYGDSGAGFLINDNNRWYLKGIISVSLSNNPRSGICDVNRFAVYCDVGKYLGWLKQYLI